jgi:hypothetical protein
MPASVFKAWVVPIFNTFSGAVVVGVVVVAVAAVAVVVVGVDLAQPAKIEMPTNAIANIIRINLFITCFLLW